MRSTLVVCLVAALGSWTLSSPARPADAERDAFACNRRLGRGINLGNGLEAPREGAWGFTLKADYFQRIKEAGFDAVRIPIRWSTHAQQQAPYTIDPAFFRRVDWAIDQALTRGLAAVINVHHYDELFQDPDRHFPRLLALWQQIARHYRDRPDVLVFELLNEPHDRLTDERWNRMIPPLLAAVRATNPRRAVVVGPGQWNSPTQLDRLRLPEDDRQLIVTFHYYSPMEFTHQGADWVPGSSKWRGTTWRGTPRQQEALRRDFARAAAWGRQHRRPLYLGEFGAYSAADMESRARWTRAVVREAEKHQMSWAYWEFGSNFGAYDPAYRAWRQPLLHALLGQKG